MTPWLIFDFLAIGWKPLTIEGRFDAAETRQRIENLSQPPADTVSMPVLRITVTGDAVEAKYFVSPDAVAGEAPGRADLLLFFRPVFRGALIEGDVVKLVGAFGASGLVRAIGFISVIILLLSIGGEFSRFGIEVAWWITGMPIFFLLMCVVSRINGADDVLYITRNLDYALRGDE